MTDLEDKMITQVSEFVGSGDMTFLETILEMDRTNTTGQSAVRYLMQIGKWRYEQNGDFYKAMEHLFGYYHGRPEIDAKIYQQTTYDIIKNAWGYECVIVESPGGSEEPKEPAKKTTKGKRSTRQKSEEGDSGSKTFKSLNENNDIDTSNASERLKKVIDIQRNSKA